MFNNFNNIKIFCDFDGTITTKDMGDELFIKFTDISHLNKKFKNNELNIYQYWHRLCKELPSSLTEKKFKEEAKNFEIDPYFKKFISFCENKGLDLFIVSDGFDTYIDEILQKNDVELPLSCNKLIFSNDSIKPKFEGASESCNCFSANCKTSYLLNKSKDNSLKIYIGDGYSDFCAAQHCDIIFAKKDLAAYCNKHSIPHHNFKTFFDITNKLKKLIENGRLKKRNRATVLSQKAFQYE